MEIEKTRVIGEEKIIQASMKDKKDLIMREKYKLKKEQIFIEHDRMRKERETQKKVVKTARFEKAKGKEVIIKYMKIKVDNEWYKWNEISNKYEIMTKFIKKGAKQTRKRKEE